MTYIVEELEKQIEQEKELVEQWNERNYYKGNREGPHQREVERLQSILALVKLEVDIIEVRNGIAFINSPKGNVVQYGLRTGKWRFLNDRVWLGSKSPKIFVEKFLSQE